MDDRIRKVMASVLDVPISTIHDKTSADTVSAWDSIKQINLIVALEEEFSIQFDDKEMVQLLNYKLIKEVIAHKLI